MYALDLTNEQVIPIVDTRLFDGHETAHLAVGIVAVGDLVVPGLAREFHAYSLLRGNVYVKQKHYMPEEQLNDDGTESDGDDRRSVHFAVVENLSGSSRMVGAMRLIIKCEDDAEPLPIEAHYPEAFISGPAPILGVECSRVIARHQSMKTQYIIKWSLFNAGIQHNMQRGLGPVYGAVEPVMARSLRIEGMPLSELAEAKFVQEFNSKKLPILIDMAELARRRGNQVSEVSDEITVSNFNHVGIAPHLTEVA